jgi:hypothetical protein
MPILGSIKSIWSFLDAFITHDGLYCYIYMSCGPKNVLPTFVRATAKTIKDDIHGIIEVDVDNIVIKTMLRSSILLDLAQVFDRLLSTCMMLSPEKCVWGVSSRNCLVS